MGFALFLLVAVSVGGVLLYVRGVQQRKAAEQGIPPPKPMGLIRIELYFFAAVAALVVVGGLFFYLT